VSGRGLGLGTETEKRERERERERERDEGPTNTYAQQACARRTPHNNLRANLEQLLSPFVFWYPGLAGEDRPITQGFASGVHVSFLFFYSFSPFPPTLDRSGTVFWPVSGRLAEKSRGRERYGTEVLASQAPPRERGTGHRACSFGSVLFSLLLARGDRLSPPLTTT
jgi:hypothetical protein